MTKSSTVSNKNQGSRCTSAREEINSYLVCQVIPSPHYSAQGDTLPLFFNIRRATFFLYPWLSWSLPWKTKLPWRNGFPYNIFMEIGVRSRSTAVATWMELTLVWVLLKFHLTPYKAVSLCLNYHEKTWYRNSNWARGSPLYLRKKRWRKLYFSALSFIACSSMTLSHKPTARPKAWKYISIAALTIVTINI